jgi:hypothetical protein
MTTLCQAQNGVMHRGARRVENWLRHTRAKPDPERLFGLHTE